MKYKRLRTGRTHQWFKMFRENNFVGVSYGLETDISADLFENWRDFNKKYIDKIIDLSGGTKSRVGAGLNCGVIWTLSKGIEIGNVILCQDENKNYHACKVTSNYYFSEEEPHHRRKVEWIEEIISPNDLSSDLYKSLNAQNTLIDISTYETELENLIKGNTGEKITTKDPTIEEPSEFALEKHLEDFLIQNWSSTSLGKNYDIYSEEGELVGQQYQSDTGPIDILAISKDKKTLLVVELKKGRVSDSVVGQIQRYMGFVKSDLADKDQEVKGVIIGLEDDIRLTRALSVTTNIEFYKYKVNFKLSKA